MKAFPKTKADSFEQHQEGMDLRDYFASKAMQSLMSEFLKKELDEVDPNGWMDGISSDAYMMADKMLKAREV